MAQRSLFNIPSRTDREADNEIAKKTKVTTKTPATTKRGGGIVDRINRARLLIEQNFDTLSKTYRTITTEAELDEFIQQVLYNKIVAIDTETTGLDPLQDELVGISLSTEDDNNVYIPLNHISYIDHTRIQNQLPIDVVRRALESIRDGHVFIVMFNAAFDIRFIWNNTGVRLHCDWDCYIAARLMNENEGAGNNGLKALHKKYCEDEEKEAFKFSDLFDGICFNQVPVSVGYIYAANDSKITLELYKFQKQYLYYEPECEYSERNGMNGVAWVFYHIEMPCVDVVVEMENTGVKFDMDYNNALKEKYHTMLDEREKQFHNACVECGLPADVNINSVQQLQSILYDRLNLVATDSKTHAPTRSTSESALKSISPTHPIVDAVLQYREFSTIVSTFIDKMPNCVNQKDGRVHCKFNQYGADTGRFSSNDPNMQNIPSHIKEIRKMFVASDGCVLLSSDYSQQEPSCLASLCNEMGYPSLYEARKSGDDIYSHVASACFNKTYEECCEFAEDGSKNPPEYKERRSRAKPVLLGILYGRGDDSVAEGMNISIEEAKQLKANLYNKYPEIKKFEDASIKMAEEFGYVTTVCGRKRRLPSMTLPDYEVKWKDGEVPDLDPLSFDSESDGEVPYDIQRKWIARVYKAGFKNKRKVFEDANKEGLWIVDNTRNKDVTKVVNARIQGSAADLTKLAMIDLYNNQELRDLGFKLLIPVHDEIIAECPLENAKKCSKLLVDVMSKAAEKILHMPFKCDVEVSREWNGDPIEL